MNIYFIILCCIYVFPLGATFVELVKSKNGKIQFIATLISVCIQLFFVYKAIKVGF